MTETTVYETTEDEAAALAEKEAKEKEEERKRELVATARKRFKQAEDAESEIRRLADEDTKFRAGQQWDPKDLKQRDTDGRPALVINRIPQFERQITNEQRQSKPAVQVSPVDSGADKETAETIQGLIRHIEYDSDAEVAYDTALTHAVRGGFGYIRIVSEFEDEGSFDQCLKIKRVRDQFSIYLDPSHQEQDASDANWGFVVDEGISEDEFKEQYPDVEPAKGGWGTRLSNGHECQVVEYFYREREPDELLALQQVATEPVVDEAGQPAIDPATGQPAMQEVPVGAPFAVFKSDVDANPEMMDGHVLVTSRKTVRIRVKWATIAGDTVIEETEFPSKYIPIVPVLGDELIVEGKRVLEGVVRHAKDPQRVYNHWSTSITETIASAPKAPWVGYKGQFKDPKWRNAAKRNYAYLEVDPVSIGGQPAPFPQRNTFEAPIGAMTTALQLASDDMKGTTGIYDAALGNRSNEQSGRAILAREQQSQVSTTHYPDNLARALKQVGRILVDAIPRVYDGARVLRILGEDGTPKMVGVNGAPLQTKQSKVFDLGTGKYDVTVSMGPSYTSKRREAAATQMEFVRVYPQAAPLVGDLVAENMDWPGAAKFAERLKKGLPPHLQEPDDKENLDPGQLLQQLQQTKAQFEQLGQVHNQLMDAMESKTLELQSAERKDLIAKHADLAKAFAGVPAEDREGREVIALEMRRIALRLGSYFPPAPEAPAPDAAPNQQQGGMP